MRFVLIDTLWGNGGYAGSEVVVSYLDRDYAPGRGYDFGALVRHELIHAITDQLERSTPWPLAEGVAVYATGGHYKPEPLQARAAALREMGALPRLGDLFEGFRELPHEERYAAVGAFVQYFVEVHGWEAFLDMYDEDIDAPWDRWLNRASRRVVGVTLAELQAGFDGWLDEADPADQVIDLTLTIDLQVARRSYQANHAPYPSYLRYSSVTAADQVALALRESGAPEQAALEAMIAAGQAAVADGRYDDAATLLGAIEGAVDSGSIHGGLGSDYLGVARALNAGGLELVSVTFDGLTATALATRRAPELTQVELVRLPAGWALAG